MSKPWAVPSNEKGEFIRKESQFRNFIEEGGQFPPEANRYHLYISLACPWAHRTLITRNLKGLQDVIGLSVVHYLMGGDGWEFASPVEVPGCIPDTVNGAKLLREIYLLSDPEYDGRITVPVLFDKQTKKIVNNESSEIIRIFNSSFNNLAKNPSLDLYPADLSAQIDEINEWIYNGLNNGVYKAGFATAQDAYEKNARLVHDSLLKVEKILKANEPNGYLCGSKLTEADIRLFTTIVRFDPVYVGHFKCNLVTVKDLPALSNWMKRIFDLEGIKETVNMEHIKKHYYMSHVGINPTRIVPLSDGPLFDESI